VYTTLLPVEHLPPYIYGVPCDLQAEHLVQQLLLPFRDGEMAPFILRENTLYAFQDLIDPSNPFFPLSTDKRVERIQTLDWWDDPDKARWFVALLNRALNKLTGRRGLHLDKEHNRYYFPVEVVGHEREVSYRPLNQSQASRKVVWQPRRKATGETKGFWYHRAVALRFLRASTRSWVLSVRPELRITTDGVTLPRSELIGRRVNRKMSHMFNYDLLGEVHFWRDYLSDSQPRLLFPFGAPIQHIRISTNLLSGRVQWPGIPEEYARPFRNAQYADDLFSYANLLDLIDIDPTDFDVDDVDDDEPD
jgi:hypothetical protein